MSGFARWGWLAWAINLAFVVANLLFLVAGTGGPLNWMAVIICAASGIYCWSVWIAEVADEKRDLS